MTWPFTLSSQLRNFGRHAAVNLVNLVNLRKRDHRTAVKLMDGNPNVLRLLVRERTMSEAELEGAIKCLRVAARTASVGV